MTMIAATSRATRMYLLAPSQDSAGRVEFRNGTESLELGTSEDSLVVLRTVAARTGVSDAALG
jgi:hypothetical protein